MKDLFKALVDVVFEVLILTAVFKFLVSAVANAGDIWAVLTQAFWAAAIMTAYRAITARNYTLLGNRATA